MAVIGGSESQAVRVSGNLFESRQARVDLRLGDRDRPDEASPVQDVLPGRAERRDPGAAGRDVRRRQAKAENVVVIDSQDDYSLPLASGHASASARGRRRFAVSPSRPTTPTSRRSSRTSGATWTSSSSRRRWRSAANTLSNQLREQGKKAIVFGTDGAYSPSQFKPRTGYVSVVRAGPALRCAGARAHRPRVQPVLEEQGRSVPSGRRRTWRLGRDGRDHEGVRRRQRDARRGDPAYVRATNIPSIIGGTRPVRREG